MSFTESTDGEYNPPAVSCGTGGGHRRWSWSSGVHQHERVIEDIGVNIISLVRSYEHEYRPLHDPMATKIVTELDYHGYESAGVVVSSSSNILS